ncbi:MAG TPA: efflux RND transporter periplasmic adaptor subunit [Anaerolineales bacterium]|nr:efflux RND transporter periplasmic adaptor subunit [Anaerolineales bacterium]
MKRLYSSVLLTAILVLSVTPAFAAQDGTVVASAVVVPSQITRLSFLTSAIVKEVAVKKGDDVTAGQTLAILNTPEMEYNVMAAQEELRSRQAYAELQRYKRVLDIRKGKKFWDLVPPEVRQRADAQAAGAQAALEIAQASLAQSTLIAPLDANVASVDVVPGEFVKESQVVITLATLNDLQLETTDLSERDIPNVKIGAPVSIFMESLHETFSGEVVGISPKADIVGGDVVFKVTIAFDKQPENLLWGMTAEVTIEE